MQDCHERAILRSGIPTADDNRFADRTALAIERQVAEEGEDLREALAFDASGLSPQARVPYGNPIATAYPLTTDSNGVGRLVWNQLTQRQSQF
jgi:hypothetical protein